MSGCPLRRPPAEYFEFNPATGLISAYTGTDVDVVVPREIGGVTVVGFEGQNAFAFCQDFAKITVFVDGEVLHLIYVDVAWRLSSLRCSAELVKKK